MFGTIRKHQTWLWVVIIGIMIFGLIQWQNQLGKSGGGERGGGTFGAIDGHPITDTEMRHAQKDASLNYFINTHEWPDIGAPRAGWNQTIETYKQVFLVRKLQQYDIHTDPDLVARYAAVVIQRFGNGETIPPETFVSQALTPHGITTEDFQRFLEHSLSVQQLAAIVGNSGKLVSPAEIQSLYVRDHQERTADAVFFSASNYLATAPEPAPTALQQFYTSNTNEYALPDQMQLSYVFFNITNFLPQAEKDLGTNLSTEVEAAYRRAGTNAITFGKTPDEAKAKIREFFIRQDAISNAYTKALSFQTEVMAKEPTRAENLSAIAKEKGLEAKVTEPFDKEYGPNELHLSSSFPVTSLFNLSAEDPFPDLPVRGVDGVYVVGFNKFVPAHVPPLDQIRSRVVADYKFVQARRTAQVNGSTFAQTIDKGLAQRESFSAICAEAKVKPVEVPAFSQSSESVPQVEDHVDLATFKRFAFDTPVGKASEFLPTSTGGFVVYVRQQLPIDPLKMQTDLPEFSKSIRQERQNAAFEAWFGKEANAALGAIPELQNELRRGRS